MIAYLKSFIFYFYFTENPLKLQSCFEKKRKFLKKRRLQPEDKIEIKRCRKFFRITVLKRLHRLKKTKQKFLLKHWEKYFFQ